MVDTAAQETAMYTLNMINVNALLENDTAAIIKIDGVWYIITNIVNNTKYFYSVDMGNGDTFRTEVLERDHGGIRIITPNECADYGIDNS
jgi:hypothetical protein